MVSLLCPEPVCNAKLDSTRSRIRTQCAQSFMQPVGRKIEPEHTGHLPRGFILRAGISHRQCEDDAAWRHEQVARSFFPELRVKIECKLVTAVNELGEI